MMKGWWLDDVQDLILQEYTRLVAQPADVVQVDDDPIELAQGPTRVRRRSASQFIESLADQPLSDDPQENQTITHLKDDLRRYINFDISCSRYSDSSNYNATLFYRKYESQFPLIARLARNFLWVPATSVPADSLFSIMGIIIDEQRNRLEPAVLDSISLIKNNQ